jgi:hypothetical protein
MWDPQPFTTLRASKACRGENFTVTFNIILLIFVDYSLSAACFDPAGSSSGSFHDIQSEP